MPAVQSTSTKLTTTARAATASSDAGSACACTTRRMRAYKPGLTESGIGRDGPRPKATKSFRLMAPIAIATTPSVQRTASLMPMARKTFSHAAMNAKYTTR